MNSPISRPMLAARLESRDQIKYPCFVSPKLDGIRCLIVNGIPLTRKFKPIPNKHITSLLSQLGDCSLDGELIIPGKSFNDIQSAIMSQEGTPFFEFWIFDWFAQPKFAYEARLHLLKQIRFESRHIVSQILVEETQELDEAEAWISNQFENEPVFEGFCYRSPAGIYKSGRSTLSEFYLAKWKTFQDSEARIIGFEELQHNTNPQEKDEFGKSKRSNHQAGMQPGATLGGIVVRDLQTGVVFGIGSGLDDSIRKEIWLHQQKYLGKVVRYKYQQAGMKDKPRFPIFMGFRHENDIDEPDGVDPDKDSNHEHILTLDVEPLKPIEGGAKMLRHNSLPPAEHLDFPVGTPLVHKDSFGKVDFTGEYIGTNVYGYCILEDFDDPDKRAQFPKTEVSIMGAETTAVQTGSSRGTVPRVAEGEGKMEQMPTEGTKDDPLGRPLQSTVPVGSSFTPAQISKLLGVEPISVRKKLRTKFGVQHKAWNLSKEQVLELWPELETKV